ncbi:MAG: hypothetical protein E6I78_05675 [Chloroflexi bacterium]|nr:MAG: hypothetical protein E6I78_05675 [Chloroflexota bacterium]
MERLLTRAGLVAVALAGLVLVGWISYSRAAFGTWNPTAQPNRIDYCDRRYFPGWHFTRTQIDARGNGLGVFPFRQVAMTASGAPLFAKPLPASVRQATPYSGPLPCAMTVYMKVGPDDYVAYGISGALIFDRSVTGIRRALALEVGDQTKEQRQTQE